jgi:hypothetical protein
VQKERLENDLSVTAYGMTILSHTSIEAMLSILWKLKANEEEI